jgi:hypothetical protein
VVGLLIFGSYGVIVAELVFFGAGRLALLAADANRCVIQQCFAHEEPFLAAAPGSEQRSGRRRYELAMDPVSSAAY